MRSAARHTAVVLMMALVAVLVVTTGGTARSSHQRVSAGTGHVTASPSVGGQADHQAYAPQEHRTAHLDLASTPPVTPASIVLTIADTLAPTVPVPVGSTEVAPTGRAPPAP